MRSDERSTEGCACSRYAPSGEMKSECDMPAEMVRPSCARRRSSERISCTRSWQRASPPGSTCGNA